MSLEQIYEPRSKKAKLDDSDIEKTRLRQIQELELALDNNQPRLVLELAQKITTSTGLDQKLSVRLLEYVFEMRNKNSSISSNDLARPRSERMTPNAVCEYLSNRTIFRRTHSIDGFLDVVRLHLRNQTIDLKTKEGNEQLHRIVAAGDTTLATLLLKAADVDVKARDPVHSRTLLHAALRSCNIESNELREEFARLLLDQGAEVDARCARGRSVLYTAIVHARCSYRLVEELMLKRGAVVEAREGGHMLWTALEEGRHEIAAMLVRSRTRLDRRRGHDSHTILQEVLRSRKIDNPADREELVRLMLNRGVVVNACDVNGDCALDDAMTYRHCSLELVEELLAHGARLRRLAHGDYLWAAIEGGKDDMVAKLVRSGVDLSVCKGDHSLTTPLLALLRSAAIADKTEQIVRLMLDRKVDVDACDGKGSVLDEVIKHNHCSTQLVEGILELCAVPCSESIIRLAARHKPRLLPKLVELRVPDKERRNIRAALALELLIVNDYGADRMADVTWAVKEILGLGVPTSILENNCGEQPCSFLNLALRFRKKDVVELLLQYGADPHQKNEFGYTPLFQSMECQDTHISRWLIEKGASVHALNDDGWSPIYGACMHESVKHLQLLLDLGADINVVDSNGYSPLDTMNLVKLNDAGYLLIKYFALIVAKGGTVSDQNMANINKCFRGQSRYKECLKEIEKMKVTNLCADMSYFSLFTKNMLRIPSAILTVKQNINNLSHSFPRYHDMLSHSFKIVKMRYELFQVERVHIQEAFEGFLPDLVMEKIARYSAVESGKQYQRNYYLSLHATV